MNDQDFEAYADFKKFNYSVAPTFQRAVEEALQLVGPSVDTVRVLDYGCGDGKYFEYLLTLGLSAEKVFGLEVSQRRIERCHAMGWDNVQLIPTNGALPFPA